MASRSGFQILVGELHVAKVHVIIKAVLRGRAERELGMRVQVLDGLGHDVRSGVAQYVQFLFLRAFPDRTVLVNNLHMILLLNKNTPGIRQGCSLCTVPP